MNVDGELLKALRKSPEGIDGAELAAILRIGRATVSMRIKELRSLGYEIEANPHNGYRLLAWPDLLHADDLLARLGRGKVIGRDIQVFQETASTNDVIEKLASAGAKEGIVVFAESQTNGRGRLGRKWISPARKGLWFSILLRPNLSPQEATQVTVASATAVRRAIERETDLPVTIKWPNDICVSGKKVSGILTELHAEPERIRYLVLGIGIDVNLTPGDLPPSLRAITTSLKIELGRPVERAALAASVLSELDRDYGQITSGRFAQVADEWEQHCLTLGQQVTIRTGSRQIAGRAEALDEDGALLLRTEHGHLERIVGGDVTLEK